MASTPLWVPLTVAIVGVLGTLAAAVFTQIWQTNSQRVRERTVWQREDIYRTYEHRRQAYVEFLRELSRLQMLFDPEVTSIEEQPQNGHKIFTGLYNGYSDIAIYGSNRAREAAFACLQPILKYAGNPADDENVEGLIVTMGNFRSQIRVELGVTD